jgi:hypothetical protein
LVCLLLALTAVFGHPSIARADVDRAERLFNSGVEDMLAGRFEQGCTRIAQSQKEDPKPGTVFTLAECFARWGRIASAATQYAAYLETVRALPPNQQVAHAERVVVAKSEYEKLLPDIPELVLVWPGAPPRDATVTVDGAEIDQETLGRARHVDPGQHMVAVSYPDGSQSTRKVAVELGQTLRVILPSASGDRPPPIPEDRSPATDEGKKRGTSQRTWAYIIGGLGTAGVLVGAATGIFVLQQTKVIDKECKPIAPGVEECSSDGLSAARDAKAAGTVSTIAFAVGGAGLAVAIPLLLTAPSEPTHQAKRRSGWQVGLNATPGGGGLSLKGSF